MDGQQKIFTGGLLLVLAIIFTNVDAFASYDNGPQAPVGGNGFGESYIQETTDADEGMSGDDHEMENEGNW